MNDRSEGTSISVYLKRNRLLLYIGIFLIVLGLISDILWFSKRPALYAYLLNLFPGLSLLLTWYLSSRYTDKRCVFVGFGTILTIVITVFTIFSNIAGLVVVSAINPVVDSSQYYEVRKQLGDSELIKHFPDSIPSNATNVVFYYFGGFMQAGASLQLRIELPKDNIADLQNVYHSKAKYIFYGGYNNDHANMPEGIRTTSFLTSGTDQYLFPDNYEILVLDAQYLGSTGFEWNHGFSYGVVISLEESEIIYWAEDW